MDYIPYTHESLLWLFSFAIIVCVIAVFAFGVTASISEASSTKRRILTVAAAFSGVAFIATLFGTSAASSSDNKASDAWVTSVTSSLSSYYGITVTSDDLYELDYPYSDPEKRVYLGTAKLATGEGMDEFAEVTLGINNGKVYLLEQDGATYTELEPATTR